MDLPIVELDVPTDVVTAQAADALSDALDTSGQTLTREVFHRWAAYHQHDRVSLHDPAVAHLRARLDRGRRIVVFTSQPRQLAADLAHRNVWLAAAGSTFARRFAHTDGPGAIVAHPDSATGWTADRVDETVFVGVPIRPADTLQAIYRGMRIGQPAPANRLLAAGRPVDRRLADMLADWISAAIEP